MPYEQSSSRVKTKVREEQRYAKAMKIAEYGHVHQFKGENNRWLVQSESDGKKYGHIRQRRPD